MKHDFKSKFSYSLNSSTLYEITLKNCFFAHQSNAIQAVNSYSHIKTTDFWRKKLLVVNHYTYYNVIRKKKKKNICQIKKIVDESISSIFLLRKSGNGHCIFIDILFIYLYLFFFPVFFFHTFLIEFISSKFTHVQEQFLTTWYLVKYVKKNFKLNV